MHKIAIVGAGIGAQHAAGIAERPDLFELTHVCDLDAAKGSALAQQFGAEYTTDFNTLLANPQVDILDICLPPHLHFGFSVQALKAGKAVVCEKPLATSLADVDALAVVSESSGRPVFPVFQYRYGPGTAQLRHLMATGLAGTCFGASLETHWNRGADYYEIPWRGTWAGEQGGAILGHAIHIHDLMTWLLGPVQFLTANLATRVNQIETEDTGAVLFRMQSGALVTSSITLGAAADTSRLRIMFEGFTVESDTSPYAPAAKPWIFTARAPTPQAAIDEALSAVPPAQSGYRAFFSEVSKALNGQPNAAVTLEDGRASLELVTAMYASSRDVGTVSFPLPDTHLLYDGWRPKA